MQISFLHVNIYLFLVFLSSLFIFLGFSSFYLFLFFEKTMRLFFYVSSSPFLFSIEAYLDFTSIVHLGITFLPHFNCVVVCLFLFTFETTCLPSPQSLSKGLCLYLFRFLLISHYFTSCLLEKGDGDG